MNKQQIKRYFTDIELKILAEIIGEAIERRDFSELWVDKDTENIYQNKYSRPTVLKIYTKFYNLINK